MFIKEGGPLEPLRVGYELYIEPIEHEVAVDRQFQFDVAFNAPELVRGEPALKTIQDIFGVVDSTITALARFIP